MPLNVTETVIASQQVKGLRGLALKAYQSFLDDLTSSGCASLRYRLTGPDPLPLLCVKHLRGRDRALVIITDVEAVVVLVAEHVEDPDRNVYDLLYAIIGVQPEPDDRRTKPPCCDAAGNPPSVDEAQAAELEAALRSFAKSLRR